MKQTSVRILGIAPYESMKTLMLNLAQNNTNIELNVFVGDLDKGVAIVNKLDLSQYDVIVSRGGTAQMLEKYTDMPVIEISMSVYDILRAIKLIENYPQKYTFIGFPNITTTAHILCDLLQYNIDIVTIHSTKEAQEQLIRLRAEGCNMVICDMITNTLAKKHAMNSILITSGKESIEEALTNAVKFSLTYHKIRKDNKVLTRLLEHHNDHVVLFNSNKEKIFSTITPEQAYVYPIIEKELLSVIETEEKQIIKNIDGNLIFIEGRVLNINDDLYIAFYFSVNNIPISKSKKGIKFQEKYDILDNSFNNFMSISNSKNTLVTIEAYNKTLSPIIIIGERGTGKEHFAGIIYSQSPLQNNTYITIDFAVMDDKHWRFLTNHYNTPFSNNDTTIYLKNIDTLNETKFIQLITIMSETSLCTRNRIILSFRAGIADTPSERCIMMMNEFSCLSLHLNPLRDRTDELPSICSLYLSQLNLEYAKQIIGFEPDAMELMQSYEWPENFTQLKRILQELVAITETPYIDKDSIEAAIKKESKLYYINQFKNKLNIDRTLDEINRDIVEQVVEECNGNQSLAAKRLGISRTTVWRLLK